MTETHGTRYFFMKKILFCRKRYGNYNAVWNY
jgi:hypothetical protein